ncbi:MobF family relaxase [Streptomyces nanshensis]|uniref:Conjugal transfer protein TraA n=1 Tax=Streptomyces nanshensis TaxID=518642 RepID=A0A1E7L8B8_9ACTN|nr:MobF family relaxase [Streptomyces nanshensis]OEV12472.1 conjugal transfer protein TraA [Streptomyces nanshensis]
MLSISAGSDPGYLTKEIGEGREHYYLRSIGEENGEPPGYWLGDGAAELGLQPGAELDNDVFTDLFSDFIDPRRRDEMYRRLAEIPHAKGSEEYARAEKAIRNDARLGSAPKNFEKAYEKRLAARLEKARADLPDEIDLTPEQVRSIELSVRKEAPTARMYYDLTFSAPKSWSVYHASLQVKALEAREAGDTETADRYSQQAEQVWDAWKTGVQAGIEHMQAEAGYSRAGHHGEKVNGRTTGRYVEARGFICGAFAQHTSRNDDPQLHVHVPVLNKVKTVDVDPATGQERTVWRSLDGTGLFRNKQAAGHLAERVAEQELERTMSVRVQMRPDGKAREIVGISQEQRDLHSSRRVAIKEGVAELARAYEERHGVPPSPYVLARMSEDVTLDQRQVKKHDAPARTALLERWEQQSQDRFREGLSEVPAQVAWESHLHELHRPAREFDPALVQQRAIEAVQDAKATWTRPDLLVELNRQLPDTLGGLDGHQVRDLLNQLADEVLDPAAGNGVTRATAPGLVEIPRELQRQDGSFVFEPNPKTHDRYATEEHLATEERLAAFAGSRGGTAVPQELVEQVLERRGLTGRQADFVRSAATSGRAADVLVGPAGAGKSYALAVLTEVWEAHEGGQVMGLASGQRAADVLAAEGIGNVANIDMLLAKNRALAEGRDVADAEKYRIPTGALVIVDEAGMTSTRGLDEVRALIEAAGSKMILSGDHFQLSAIGAGGMFAQLSGELPGVHVLEEVRRFRDVDEWGRTTVRQWEADASLKLREGDTAALGVYEDYGRFRGGSAEEMQQRAYQGWLTDHLEGRNPLLIAGDNTQVAELAARAREDLVRAGRVETDGVSLRTGADVGVETKAGRGDLIQMRKNDRTITSAGGAFAVNRLTATVTDVDDDGGLTVRLEDGGRLRLPPSYVHNQVELAYACTVHGAQGRTVGTCHSLIDGQTDREALYVSLTRGEGGNWGYVITHEMGDGIREEDVPHHLVLLDAALQRSNADQSATQYIREEMERREHLAVLEPVWSGVKDQRAEARYGRVLLQTLGAHEYATLTSEEAYGSLMRLARQVEEAGHDVEDMLRRTALSREFDTADSNSKVMHYRLTNAWNLARQDQARVEKAEQHQAVREQEQRAEETAGLVNTGALPEGTGEQAAFDAAAPGVSEQPGADLWQEDLLRQALVVQQMPVAHAGQDTEVWHRQVAEREAHMETTDSYTARTPDLDGDLGRMMREWAAEMDARVERLGQRVAEQQPHWAIERLGPVPDDPIKRAAWEQRAGRVERYREAHGHADERNAIGQAPPDGAVEARADWERARRALGVDGRAADVARASDEQLRQTIQAYEREEEWAPPHVAEDLQQTALARRDYADQAVQMELRAKEIAEQEAAEHEETVTGALMEVQTVQGTIRMADQEAQALALQQAHVLQAEIDPSERQKEIEERAQTSREVSETMAAREEKLREVHETRGQWHVATELAREDAEHAAIELERRAPEPDSNAEPHSEARAEDASTAATQPSQEEVEAHLAQALWQAREAQRILTERAQEREQDVDAESKAPEQAEELDRERRDVGLAEDYARIGSSLAYADHDLTAAGQAPQPEPEPAPQELASPEMPEPDIEP